MPFQKGNKLGGRKPGKPNKDTARFKDALNELLERSAPHMVRWLDEIAQESPEKAFGVLRDFAEYIHPKLARTEQQMLDKDGKPADNKMTVEFVNAPSDTKRV